MTEIKKYVQDVLKSIDEKVINTNYEIQEKFTLVNKYEAIMEVLHQSPTEKNKKMIETIKSFETAEELKNYFDYLQVKSLVDSF